MLIVFNYTLDFEDQYIDQVDVFWLRWLCYFSYESIPFLFASLILMWQGKAGKFYQSGHFWLIWLIGFLILALDRSVYIRDYLTGFFPSPTFNLWIRSLNWSLSIVWMIVPLMILYESVDRNSPHRWYGLAISRFDPRPYFYLLLIAGVGIGIGSFFGEIQEYYPRYRIEHGQRFAAYYDVSQWVPLSIYELSYASNFITVELFFRGFLIYAFFKYFGTYAVLPMIVAYCILHFGKPITESLSSIIGGYALGILALKNRNIWGGVIIHIGVAWLMELFGYLQR